MKKLTTCAIAACIATSTLIVSCSTNKELTTPSLSYNRAHNPEFLDNIALGGSANTISMRVVDKNRKTGFQTNGSKSLFTASLQQKYAYILGVVPQAITNLSLYNFIDDWYGVRYRLGGNDKSGIDCSAFVQRLYEQVFCTNLLRTAIEQFSSSVFVSNKDSLKEGDLVFFHTRKNHITHVGIYLKNNFFVHASSSQGVMISSLNEDYWQRRFAGAGEIPKN
ncbi:MAG: C40 family peptidase, partial [Flavipsychrobacter sp.]